MRKAGQNGHLTLAQPPPCRRHHARTSQNRQRSDDKVWVVLRALAVILLAGVAGGCAGRDHREVGTASWYDPGRRTFRGVTYDSSDLTAAHRSLPFGTPVRVTNLENGRRVTVVVNDRGPFVRGRVIDVSKSAARRLGIVSSGLARVRIEAPRRVPSRHPWWRFWAT
jgi:rare lipoprotein A